MHVCSVYVCNHVCVAVPIVLPSHPRTSSSSLPACIPAHPHTLTPSHRTGGIKGFPNWEEEQRIRKQRKLTVRRNILPPHPLTPSLPPSSSPHLLPPPPPLAYFLPLLPSQPLQMEGLLTLLEEELNYSKKQSRSQIRALLADQAWMQVWCEHECECVNVHWLMANGVYM